MDLKLEKLALEERLHYVSETFFLQGHAIGSAPFDLVRIQAIGL
jgi:hypothetical protein